MNGISIKKYRQPEAPVDPIFVRRWSPRAMAGEAIPLDEVLPLFEAAKWAPSAFNAQPWRFLYALRGGAHWEKFFGLLVPGNQEWCKEGAALVVMVARKLFEHNAKPNGTAAFDAGAAWENLALQGSMKGFVVHGMAGFDRDRARAELNVPEEFDVMAMAVIGRPGDPERLSEGARQREFPSGRKKLEEVAWEGGF